MAVLDIKKLNICAMKRDEKPILNILQRSGLVQLDKDAFQGIDIQAENKTEEKLKFDRKTSLIENALEIMEIYAPEKKGLLSSLEGKNPVDDSTIRKTLDDQERLMKVGEKAVEAMKKIVENRVEKDRNSVSTDTLKPWISLDIPMEFTGTKRTSFLIGSLVKTESLKEIYEAVGSYLVDLSDVEIRVVGSDKYQTCIVAVCLKENEKEVESGLHTLGFVRISGNFKGIASDEIKRLQHENEALEFENKKLVENIRELSKDREALKILSDIYRITSQRMEAMIAIPQSESTFFISGYVAEKNAEIVKKHLEEKFNLYVEITDPGEEEDVPVILENKGIGGTMESIVDSYGLPKKGEIDPSFIMGIFYVILFGMMLSDAAYGVIITATTFFLIKKFKYMEDSMRRALKMFMYCGISTIIWGILFGGYFGDAVDVISRTFTGREVTIPPVWFAPLNDPMRLLMYCLIIGLIHLFTGLGIKGYMCIKKRQFMNLFCDVILWACLLIGLVMMLLPTELFYSLSQWNISYPSAVGVLAKGLAIFGAVGILIMAGRGRKNPALRLALGAYDLYNLTSWLSDLLSYSRLLALGLATGVIASVFNQIGSMGGDSIIGIIFFIIVFIIGHVFNMAINILGAYVHTNRLQYVEFFGKFYEGGGRIFEPFKAGTKYVDMREEMK